MDPEKTLVSPSGATLNLFEKKDHLAHRLYLHVLGIASKAIKERGKFTLAISGGSLPAILAKGVRKQHQEEGETTQWSKWHVFFADERYVSLESADSNFKTVKTAFLDQTGIPMDQVYTIKRELPLPECAADYQAKMEEVFGCTFPEHPQFDLILLGMGPDGHTCSLFPNHALLAESDRWIAPIEDSPKPPPQRVTITFPVVNNAHHVIFVVAGTSKKDVLPKALGFEKSKPNEVPSLMVRPRGESSLYWYIDQDAAAKLAT